jgi:hypothetical protein
MKNYSHKNSNIVAFALSACMALIPMGQAFSQADNKDVREVFVKGVNINELKSVYYVELIAVANEATGKVTAEVDYGQGNSEEHIITEKDGKHRNFESVIDALNFMHKNGWEFLNAFELKTKQHGNAYHFLLKRVI